VHRWYGCKNVAADVFASFWRIRCGLPILQCYFFLYNVVIKRWSRFFWRRIMADAGTLTRADLAEMLNRQVGLSRADSATMIESILDHMTDAIISGENVKISGFGTFVLRDKAQRIGRNPKTGVEVPITPRRVLTFRASQGMRQKVK
jgi:integration host factor subunit alpha